MDRADNLDRYLLCGGRNRRTDDYPRSPRVVSKVEQARLDTAKRSLRTCMDVTLRQHGIGRVDGLAERTSRNVTPALSIFAIQLIFNVAWSGLFFGLHSPGAGLLAIVASWCAIAATILSFRRAVASAGWILVPYLAWVSFAMALNFEIWRLNK